MSVLATTNGHLIGTTIGEVGVWPEAAVDRAFDQRITATIESRITKIGSCIRQDGQADDTDAYDAEIVGGWALKPKVITAIKAIHTTIGLGEAFYTPACVHILVSGNFLQSPGGVLVSVWN